MAAQTTSYSLAASAAAVCTTATFSKSFVPFYLIGSTSIFAATCLAGLVLVALNWRGLIGDVAYLRDILVTLGLLYVIVVASFLVNSLHRVPVTHLAGIFIFHSLFLLFGFAAARSLKAVFAVLLVQAAVYVVVIAQYTARFGDLMADGYLHDIFGVGYSPVYTFAATFHQQIGVSLGLAVIAALGIGTKRIQLCTLVVLPFVLIFMLHISARTGIVALIAGLLFWALLDVWIRSRKAALLSASVLLVLAVIVSVGFYEYAVQDKDVDAQAPDAIARSIREIQSRKQDLRLPTWERTWHRITTQPDHLLLGHGVGSFPIDEGAGPPDWLLHQTEGAKHHPHNIHLDVLYESGIVGLLVFGALTLFPLISAFWYWERLPSAEKAAFALYAFYLCSMQLSGAFAFDYTFQFFLAVALGVIALRRKQELRIGHPSKMPT